MTLKQFDTSAYSKISGFRYFSYNCINYLLENNEVVWKLLFYNETDALNKPNLTKAQKRSMIYKGEPDETLFNVFASEKQTNAWLRETCILRIFPHSVVPDNRTVNTTAMVFDIYTHYRVDTLNDGTTRTDTVVEEIINLFNGSNIGGLGRLFFNSTASRSNKIYDSGQIPYGGKRIIMATKQN